MQTFLSLTMPAGRNIEEEVMNESRDNNNRPAASLYNFDHEEKVKV